MNARDANRNLLLEIVSLLLFLASLVFVSLAVVATATYLGIETIPELEMTEDEKARFGPNGFWISLGVVLAPAALFGFLVLGIRLWLVRRPSYAGAPGHRMS